MERCAEWHPTHVATFMAPMKFLRANAGARLRLSHEVAVVSCAQQYYKYNNGKLQPACSAAAGRWKAKQTSGSVGAETLRGRAVTRRRHSGGQTRITDNQPSVVGQAGRSCHDARCRLRHVVNEGGSAPVWDIHSSGGERLVGFGVFCRPLGSPALESAAASSWLGGFIRTERYHPAGIGGSGWFPVAVNQCAGEARALVYRWYTAPTRSVDNVHAFHLGLARTSAGLPRVPQVSAISHCFQGLEARSSPTSGTAYPLVRGGFCFNVCTKLDKCLCVIFPEGAWPPGAACSVWMGERGQRPDWWALRWL
ncbi:phenylacetaldoxime dehydratase family protein [Arthrobacter sp. StoSoilB5]|uniref:phenylacetaldoxime dehydratase family protein n=1 Tax=Arthrobacter sp. StoSoilB5 TaxID=2830992 RepID=UPI0021E166C6|nr:phenylacetaldoxime dehydratase family protein [Arthrobacter sp. StoSoilB5]